MASYLQNSQDYIPALQPFQPDLNYYSGVIASKQQSYDENLSKLNSIYGSALNSPLSRSDNQERRSKYFDTIEQDIKKAAGTDLSIDQNLNSAKRIFDPILNDQHIIKDMSFTRGLQNAYKTSEQFRNCVDPDKCQGSFWEEGVTALQYAQEEFQNASPDDSLRYQAPTYTPYQNVTQKAMKAAKEAGFNISYDHNDERYTVTDTNGQLLLGRDGKGILPQYLYGMFGNDSAVQKMYQTQAYVQRKNYAKMNAGKFGGNEDAAESEYLNGILGQVVPKIESAQRDSIRLRDDAKTDITATETLVKNNGGTFPGDGTQDAYDYLNDLISKTNDSEKYHQQVADLISTAPNINDLKSLRSRVDGIVANANFINTIDTAAYDYAMGTAKHETKADPYALAAYNNSLDLSKSKQLKDYDNQIWQQQQALLGNIDGPNGLGIKSQDRNLRQQTIQAIIKNNISQDELLKLGITKLDKTALTKLAESGLLNTENTETVKNFALISSEAEPFQNTYYENSKVIGGAMDQAVGNSKNFIKTTLTSMINSFKNADTTQGKDAVGIKDKLLVDMKSILQGTGIDYNEVMRGEVPLDSIPDSSAVKMADVALKLRTKSVPSRVYDDGYDDASLAKVQAANQAAEGLYSQRNAEVKSAVATAIADRINSVKEGDLNPVEYKKQVALYNSFLNPNGGMVTPLEAKNRFIKASVGLYGATNKTDFSSAEEENYYANQNAEAYKKATIEFDQMYIPALKYINSKLTSFTSKPTSRDAGGMVAVENTVEKKFNGNSPFSPDTRYVQNMIVDFANNLDNNDITVTGAGKENGLINSQNLQSDPAKQDLLIKLTDKIKSGDIKDLGIKTQIQYIPKTFDQSAFSFDSSVDKAIYTDPTNASNSFPGTFTPEGVLVKMTVGEDVYRHMYGIKKNDPVSGSDRSFVVSTGTNFKSLSPFLEGIQKSPEEVYMQKPGNTLALDLGQKGTASIERGQDGRLYIRTNTPEFNTDLGEWGQPRQNTFLVPEQKLENAYPIITSKLNDAHLINKSNVNLYSNYARSNQNK